MTISHTKHFIAITLIPLPGSERQIYRVTWIIAFLILSCNNNRFGRAFLSARLHLVSQNLPMAALFTAERCITSVKRKRKNMRVNIEERRGKMLPTRI